MAKQMTASGRATEIRAAKIVEQSVGSSCHRACVFALTAFVTSLLVGRRAEAAGPPPVEVEWQAPAECPAVEFVRAQVDRLLVDSVGEDRPIMRAHGSIVRDATTDLWRLNLLLSRGDVEAMRAMSHPECDVLTRSAALVIAIAIDPTLAVASGESAELLASDSATANGVPAPESTKRQTPGEVSTASNDTKVDETSAPQAIDLEPAPRRPDSLSDDVRASSSVSTTVASPSTANTYTSKLATIGGIGAGALPRYGVGLGLAYDVTWGRLGLAATPMVWLPRTVELGQVPADVVLTLPTVGLDGCWSLVSRRNVTLPLCVGGDFGVLVGRGRPVVAGSNVTGRTAATTWVAVHAGLRPWWWPTKRLGLGLHTEFAVPLTRTQLVVNGLGPVDQVAGFDARVFVGVARRFGLTKPARGGQ